MSKPDYMSKIQETAAAGAAAAEMWENDVMRAWFEFSQHASDLLQPYDILDSADQRLIELAESLVTVLYRASPGTPESDCEQIRAKNAAYGGSWARRGGTGAFHALARKGDRLEEQLRLYKTFDYCRSSPSGEAIDDTLGDLRRYLILVLSWHEACQSEPSEEKILQLKEDLEQSLMKEQVESTGESVRACAECGHNRDRHASFPPSLDLVLENAPTHCLEDCLCEDYRESES